MGAIELSTVFITLKTDPPSPRCKSSLVHLVRSLRSRSFAQKRERERALVLNLPVCLALSLYRSLFRTFVSVRVFSIFPFYFFLFCFVLFSWRNGFEVSDATPSRAVYGQRTS